jgi:hypothetical protein
MQNWPRSECCGGTRKSRPVRHSLVKTVGPVAMLDQSRDVQLEHANEHRARDDLRLFDWTIE